MAELRPFWVSWWANPAVPFTWDGPWWISGWRFLANDDEQDSICAAVMAASAAAAEAVIRAAHDDPSCQLEFRFCEERPLDWSPFSERFPRRDWMRWQHLSLLPGAT